MNVPAAGHRPVDERRAQLLDAALAVLREHGLAGLTTRAVTTRAGVPHGIFHYAFGSKAALVRALVERELTGATAAWDAAVATDDLETALRRALRAQLDIVRADPAHQAAMYELIRAARDDSDVSTVAWERRQYLAEIERQLGGWSQRGGVTWTAPVEHVAALVLSAADGVIQAWVADHDDERADASVDLLARAIASLARPA
ncbi:TetR/AcrR family transcriptional regulator [Cellulomonas dongxiuzhuiae]|uniref:TetR/AcrR family transcriptional regulator n=1 Tax=Cellulomonas dongxiuzhuiae TaxID=2819979 RepID=UPI001AAF3190|nr:TetR/AcrR family transcriptional regulator [Cellulomonas dongxiuzhuiae]MBO3089520.1 TetR/AcrR family transcriptional regulator [Cellulomonas dongxiuzhuiae]